MIKMENKEKTNQLAAIRVRGIIGVNSRIEGTLKMLRLYKNNYCCVLPNNQIYVGMLKKAKDYITWGEIDDDTFNSLVDKRGEESNAVAKKGIAANDSIMINNKKIKKFFRLSPPRKGFERKGIKHSFSEGGVLGYRGVKINDLIKRML